MNNSSQHNKSSNVCERAPLPLPPRTLEVSACAGQQVSGWLGVLDLPHSTFLLQQVVPSP